MIRVVRTPNDPCGFTERREARRAGGDPPLPQRPLPPSLENQRCEGPWVGRKFLSWVKDPVTVLFQAVPLWFPCPPMCQILSGAASATGHLALASRCRPGASPAAATAHAEQGTPGGETAAEKNIILDQAAIEPAMKSPTHLGFYTRRKLPFPPPSSCILLQLLPPLPCSLDTGGSWGSTV